MRRPALICPAVFLSAVLCCAASAQTFTIQPFAGVPRSTVENGPAINTPLWSPRGVSVDNSGNVYIADSGNARIRRVTPGGVMATVAGTSPGYSGDNSAATAAQISLPTSVAFGPNGDIFIADAANRRIRRVNTAGQITTVAGPQLSGLDASLSFIYPRDIAVDRNGNAYVADLAASRVWKIGTDGRASVFAGSGVVAFYGDGGPATSATLGLPRGVAVDTAGNVYIADTNNNRIRKVDASGVILTVAGAGPAGFGGDNGPAALALLNAPSSVALSGANIYIADTGNNRIRRIDPQGNITTVTGNGTVGFAGDGGPATAAALNGPEGVAVDPSGNVYIADTGNHRVRRISAGVITTFAGVDRAAGDNGPALQARLFQPAGLAMDSTGVYISDSANNRIRKVTPDGRITTIAGTGAAGYSPSATSAATSEFNMPGGLAIDRTGNLYVADTGNNVVRMISTGGSVSTVAGNGSFGNKGDGGPAASAALNSPAAVAIDTAGRIFIADSGNNRIRYVDTNGNIQPFAGDPAGTGGFADGPTNAALFRYPRGLAFSPSTGDLYVADFYNNRIRRISAGSVTTFAGTGEEGFSDGPAGRAQFSLPSGLGFDPRNGTLYVADSVNDRVRVISGAGVVSTAAGNGGEADSGDGGPGPAATLDYPRAVIVDPASGAVYFTDQFNDRVRKLTGAEPPAIAAVQNGASFVGGPIAPGEIITIRGTQLLSATGATQVLFDGVAAPVLYASATQINAIVPNEVAGKATTTLEVQGNGAPRATTTVPVREAVVGIFTATQTGLGQAAALNADYSVNTAANPAPRGSYVQLYLTGGGLIPGLGTGEAASGAITASLSFRVQIGGTDATVTYSGAAPGFPGLMQVNVQVPATITPGSAVLVTVLAGTAASQTGVTIAVGP